MLFGILIASVIILTYFSWYARKKIKELNIEKIEKRETKKKNF